MEVGRWEMEVGRWEMGKRMLNKEIVGETHASPDWPMYDPPSFR